MAKEKSTEIQSNESPVIEEQGYSGRYQHIVTGEIFALKIADDSEVRAHRTHHAKNATHFGDYTAAEFRAQFDKL